MSIANETVFAPEEKNQVCPKTLYLVATPIGNLSDISGRALKILSEVSFVAAEDTRVSAKLLSSYGIKQTLFSYHEHNKREAGKKIVERLLAGESCALITDAGTPAISDPGADIVKACIEADITVSSLPGACAAVTALTLSGLETRRFVFEGFLEGTDAEKRERLGELSSERRTVIFYEAPHRLLATLELMLSELGDRKIALCRELTKLNEQIIRTSLSNAIQIYNSTTPKGEYVLVIEGCSSEKPFWADMTVVEHVEYYIFNMNMEKMSAVKAAAKDRGVSKNTVYKELI